MTLHYSYFLVSNQPNSKKLAETLGANVHSLRLEQGLSITTLAFICKTGRPLVTKVEKGESDVRLSYVERLAAALCVDARLLFLDFEDYDGLRFPGN